MRRRHASSRIQRTAVFTLSIGLLLVSGSGARAAQFQVNSANDGDDGLCDASHCSLREAIHAANGSPGPDLVTFDLGAATLQPGSALPTLTDDGTVIRGDGDIVVHGGQAGNANGFVIESSDNRIQGLVIRDFASNGVFVRGHVVTGPADANTIGTDGDGVDDDLERNLIQSNGGSGVRIEGPKATGNVVAGNWIGVNAAGDEARPNVGAGVSILFAADGNRVGTDADGTSDELEGNRVAANQGHGIFLGSNSNTVAGNTVGFGADGVVPLGNDWDGIAAYFADWNTIGPDNLIGNNGSNGVAIGASRGNRVIGNRIGIDAEGSPAGNGFNGVRIFAIKETPAIGNQVGVSAGFVTNLLVPVVTPLGNVIAHSGWNGIFVDSHSEGFLATNNPLLFNSIYGNALLGIDLVSSSCPLGACTDGVTHNDAGDEDGGGNDALNFPEIQSASRSSTHTYVLADIVQGLPDTRFTLQFFANPECDDDGTGEGELYLGQVQAMTDAAGNLSTFAALPVPAPVGSVITSTATALWFLGRIPVNTSEFSPCAELQAFSLEHLMDVILNLLAKLPEEDGSGERGAQALAARVERVLRHAERGRDRLAAQHLRRLHRQVGALERRGQLSPEAALPLLASSEAAIEALARAPRRPAGL